MRFHSSGRAAKCYDSPVAIGDETRLVTLEEKASEQRVHHLLRAAKPRQYPLLQRTMPTPKPRYHPSTFRVLTKDSIPNTDMIRQATPRARHHSTNNAMSERVFRRCSPNDRYELTLYLPILPEHRKLTPRRKVLFSKRGTPNCAPQLRPNIPTEVPNWTVNVVKRY